MAGTRQDQFKVTASVDGKDLGVWDKLTGGAIDSTETRYRPGAMGKEISLGGVTTVTNVVLERRWDLQREGGVINWLIGRVGKGTVVVKKLPLDVDGNAFGKPLTYTGKLKTITPPDHDSNSEAVATVVLEMVPSATVT